MAKPYRFRLRADAEGFPVIPGRYGQIEFYCDGVSHGCPLPGHVALAVYTARPPCLLLHYVCCRLEPIMLNNIAKGFMVEGKGFEPSTSALRTPRSPN